ncbi:hypothetical protein BC830DRAFT_1168321 [Chytriomyces sp. MP71]|nr:hypothetical protein BC830DRAFT_1168321 [Chytriomyces sp. MP71]
MEFAQRAALELAAVSRDSVLVVDEAMVEVLEWTLPGGLGSVLAGGSVHLVVLGRHNQQQQQPLFGHAPSVVFALSDTFAHHAAAVFALLGARAYSSCAVFLALPMRAHLRDAQNETQFDPRDGEDFFRWLARILTDSMVQAIHKHVPEDQIEDAIEDLEVTVQHLPLNVAAIANDLFCFPAVSHMFPVPSFIAPQLSSQPTDSSPVFDPLTRLVAFSLSTVLDALQIKEEIFVMGEASKLIARCMVSLRVGDHASTPLSSTASGPRPANSALIMMDRTLDLAAPMSHTDNLFDLIFRTLKKPKTESGSSLNRCVSSDNVSSDQDALKLASGADAETLDLIRVLTMLNTKEGLVAVRKRIVDIIGKVDPARRPRVLGRVTLDQMHSLLGVFKGDEAALTKYGNVLGICAAAVEAVGVNEITNGDSLHSIEQLITLSLAESGGDPACALLPLVDVLHKVALGESGGGATPPASPPTSPVPRTPKRDPLTLRDALRLAVYAYSLMDPRAIVAGAGLRDRVGNAFTRALKRGGEAERAWVSEVLQRLEALGRVREGMRTKSLVVSEDVVPVRSLLRRVLARELAGEAVAAGVGERGMSGSLAARIEAEDLTHISYGGTLGTVLSGFSRLLGAARPRPKDYETIIVFVVGGITAAEVRDVREIVREHGGGVNVIIGSTVIANADEILLRILPSIPS